MLLGGAPVRPVPGVMPCAFRQVPPPRESRLPLCPPPGRDEEARVDEPAAGPEPGCPDPDHPPGRAAPVWGERLPPAERRTVLFVTHNVQEAVFLGDRIVVMSWRPGRVKAEIVNPLERPRVEA